MSLSLSISDYLAAPPYDVPAATELAAFLADWDDLHADALHTARPRIHPTAYVHPSAIIGSDVIIGPHAKVWEFSTVRAGSFVGREASVGFNCEVTHSYLSTGAVLGHRIGLNRAIVGADVHLSANVTAAAIHLTTDMRKPDREVILRVPSGLYRCGTSRFSALIGDGVQTGADITLAPGTAIGPGTHIGSGVTLPPARVLPARSLVSAPHVTDISVISRRHRRP
ncbi:transferase [Streptomyces sp. NPDC054861]